MPRYDHHIFICENTRADGHPRGSCTLRGSGSLREAFRAELQRRGLTLRCRANMAGCLDSCEMGPVVVVYPEGIWYGGVTEADVPEIVERHIAGGAPVARLLIRDPRYGQQDM